MDLGDLAPSPIAGINFGFSDQVKNMHGLLEKINSMEELSRSPKTARKLNMDIKNSLNDVEKLKAMTKEIGLTPTNKNIKKLSK